VCSSIGERQRRRAKELIQIGIRCIRMIKKAEAYLCPDAERYARASNILGWTYFACWWIGW